jgi:hypothetical protein
MESQKAIKVSYFNLLACFLEAENIKSIHAKCLVKWAAQLSISPADMNAFGNGLIDSTFVFPKDEIEKMESLYHLVHMIYLDRVVEDSELEMAAIYASRLGFKQGLVANLFKSIATIEMDLTSPEEVRKEVIDFLKLEKD